MVTLTLLLCYIFLIQYNVIVESISLSSLVRFNCKMCKPKPNNCCVGTLILPNVALTTSFCAETCQSVNDIPIKKIYTQKHYNNYIKYNDFVENNVALAIIGFEIKKRNEVIMLSALDPMSAVGLKVLIPIMNSLKPRLGITYVEKCNKEHGVLNGYFVCTTNRGGKNYFKTCQDSKEQGLPLLLDNRIFGMTMLTRPAQCMRTQRIFLALEPLLPWIHHTLKHLGYRYSNRELVTSKSFINLRRTSDAYVPKVHHYFDGKWYFQGRGRSDKLQSNMSSISTNPTQSTGTTALKFIPRSLGTKLTTLFTTTQTTSTFTTLVTHETSLMATLSSMSSPTTSIELPTITSSLSNWTSGNTFSAGSTEDASLVTVHIFSIPTVLPLLNTSQLRTASIPQMFVSGQNIMLSSPNFNSTNKTSSSLIKNGTTNVMDWFRQQLKSLKNSSSPVLIVGKETHRPTSRTTPFIDLT